MFDDGPKADLLVMLDLIRSHACWFLHLVIVPLPSETWSQMQLSDTTEAFGLNDLDPEALNQVRQAILQAEFTWGGKRERGG